MAVRGQGRARALLKEEATEFGYQPAPCPPHPSTPGRCVGGDRSRAGAERSRGLRAAPHSVRSGVNPQGLTFFPAVTWGRGCLISVPEAMAWGHLHQNHLECLPDMQISGPQPGPGGGREPEKRVCFR